MRLRSAAMGIAAVGAGLVVARLLRGREPSVKGTEQAPPNPDQLLGIPESHKDAAASAEVFQESRRRPV